MRRPAEARGPAPKSLSVGQEGLFALQRVPATDLYVPVQHCPPVAQGEKGYADELKQVRELGKAMEDPVKALGDADKKARYENLRFLMQRYLTQRNWGAKTTPKRVEIPAEQSRLMVGMLASVSWDKADPATANVTAQEFFHALAADRQVNPWVRPAQTGQPDYPRVYAEAASKWLKDNAATIRVRKYVYE